MKLATVLTTTGATGEDRPTEEAAVVLDGGQLLLLDVAAERAQSPGRPDLGSVLAIIEGGDRAREAIDDLVADPPEEAVVALEQARLAAPIPRPPQIRDFGCFFDHFRNIWSGITGEDPADAVLPAVIVDRPLYYLVNRLAVIGGDEEVAWPAYSHTRDYELELACVIGTAGTDIARDDALGHVFGFTIFNDLSARDTQMEEISSGLGMSKGKDFDGANVFGPWITTLDEIGDPHDLIMRARINGEEVSSGSTSSMDHRFEDVIAFASRSTTLHPGEHLCSGTMPWGCGLEHGRYLEPGDTVELEVERIGILRTAIR